MAEPESVRGATDSLPEAAVESRRRLSVIWIIPIVAAIAAGWLGWKTLAEMGPLVTIVFDSAEGLKAGQTPVKHKDVDIGMVESIALSPDLKQVVVKARMARELEPFLTDEARFWIVRARVSPGGVTGLGTLFSGAYIAVDPSDAGSRTHEFDGLEASPAIFGDQPGRHYMLRAPSLASTDIGSPVYFREIRVGEVVGFELADDGASVTIQVFIREPYTRFVRLNTRFWNVGGLEVALGADGLSVETGSLLSMLLGGIAFDTPPSLRIGGAAPQGTEFALFPSRGHIEDEIFGQRDYLLAYFDQSVRGLSRGAPVELLGIRVGQVADIRLELDAEALQFRVPVLLEIQPDRIAGIEKFPDDPAEYLAKLVERGLRAQLQPGSLLTGQLYVNLDMFPDAPKAGLLREGEYLLMPTHPSLLEEVTGALVSIAAQLEALPIQQIGKSVSEAATGFSELINSEDMKRSIASLAETLESVRALTEELRGEVAPAFTATLEQTGQVLENAERILSPAAPAVHELQRLLRELAEAARSLRVMADYLEQHPESLIYGKESQ
ncbi:MAG TPA: MlaD family protein [Gammaproteobacteria bacterium]|nr:MlaD family protein [Gammaproteobacteria bacterium]